MRVHELRERVLIKYGALLAKLRDGHTWTKGIKRKGKRIRVTDERTLGHDIQYLVWIVKKERVKRKERNKTPTSAKRTTIDPFVVAVGEESMYTHLPFTKLDWVSIIKIEVELRPIDRKVLSSNILCTQLIMSISYWVNWFFRSQNFCPLKILPPCPTISSSYFIIVFQFILS